MYITVIKASLELYEVIKQSYIDLIGSHTKIEEANNYLVIEHKFSDLTILESLAQTLSAELMEDISIYNSFNIDKESKNLALEIAFELLDNLPTGCYNLKKAILRLEGKINKKKILDYILAGSGITQDIIKGLALSSLNVSKASKSLYIHRNTLLYKIDKLKELKDFDLKEFLDAYILYSLTEK